MHQASMTAPPVNRRRRVPSRRRRCMVVQGTLAWLLRRRNYAPHCARCAVAHSHVCAVSRRLSRRHVVPSSFRQTASDSESSRERKFPHSAQSTFIRRSVNGLLKPKPENKYVAQSLTWNCLQIIIYSFYTTICNVYNIHKQTTICKVQGHLSKEEK